MIDENEKERQTAEKVEPQIAPALLVLVSRTGAVRGLRADTLEHGADAIDLGWRAVLADAQRPRAGTFALRARNAIAVRWASRKSDRGPPCARAPSSPTVNR